MKVYLKTIAICLIVIFSLQNVFSINAYAEGNTKDGWYNFDIRTKTSVTAEQIDKVLQNKPSSSPKLKRLSLGETFVKAGEKSGISAEILVAMFIKETGWGTNSQFLNLNNTGGMRCMSSQGYACEGGWSKFDSAHDSVYAKADLLKRLYVDENIVKLYDVLMKYAPPSDGNDVDLYVKDLGVIITANFGGNMSNDIYTSGTTSDTKSDTKGGSSGGSTEKFNPFLKGDNYNSQIGKQNSTSSIPSEITYKFISTSHWFYKTSVYVSVLLMALLIAYASITVLIYVSVVKGFTNASWFEKLMTTGGGTFETKTVKVMVGKLLGVIVIMAFIMSGWFVQIMGVIYHYISVFFNLLF